MNIPPDEKTTYPNRNKRPLIILGLLICLAGLTFGALVVWGPEDGPCNALYSKASSSIKKYVRSKALLRNLGPGKTVICRGVTLDANNNALAIIDDQTLGIGQTYKEIKIVDITSSYVLVQFQGQPYRITLGETFVLQQQQPDH